MDYTFNTKWIQLFESTWCTNEKFKFANSINGAESASILRIPLSNYNSNTNGLLTGIAAINKLEKITSSSFNNCYTTWIKMILGPLYCSKTFDRYFATYLRYCPQCLSQGYHTIYTQLLWETHCPFHGQPLEDRVPSNRSSDCRIPIDMHQRKEHGGFELKSDESTITLNTLQVFKHWQTTIDTSFIINNLPEHGNYQYGLYYMPFSINKCDYSLHYFTGKSATIKQILSLKLTEFIQLSNIISPSNLLISFTGPVNTTNIQNYITKVYLETYKSIAKHLRKQEKKILITLNALHAKKPLQYHESAIELVKKGILNRRAYAYILWSRDILGHDNYLQVGPRTLADATNISKSPFFSYLMYEVKQYFLSDYNIPIDNLLSILQYTIQKLFWAQYKNYYTLASNALNVEGKRSVNLNLKALGDMPLLVSFYDRETNTCYLLDS